MPCFCFVTSYNYYEAMGKSYRASLESNNAGLYELIWFHVQKVNHGRHFLNKTSYGAVKGEEKGPTHGFY